MLQIVLLVTSLGLDITGISWLKTLSAVAKTVVLAVVIMSTGNNAEIGQQSTHLAVYCCFALLWVLVISTILALFVVIVDREKDHLIPGNHTEVGHI